MISGLGRGRFRVEVLVNGAGQVTRTIDADGSTDLQLTIGHR